MGWLARWFLGVVGGAIGLLALVFVGANRTQPNPPSIWIAAVLGAVALWLLAASLRSGVLARRRRADFQAQLALVQNASDKDTSPPPEVDEVVLATHHDLPISLETLTHWQPFKSFDLLGQRFPDGSVAVTRLRSHTTGGEKAVHARLVRDTKISSESGDRVFDRCGVGLLRMAGLTEPVRLPHTVEYDTSGKAMRPADKVTAEAVITYIDAAGTSSTRRVSVLGFEPIGSRRRTDDVLLHAWCWDRKDYRTFKLSRIQSLMDPASARQVDKIEWTWVKGGLKFPHSDRLR